MPDPAPEEIRAFMSGLRIARRMSMRNTPTGGRPVNRSGKEALFDKDLTRRLQSHQSAPTAGKADGELLNKLRNGAREHEPVCELIPGDDDKSEDPDCGLAGREASSRHGG